jgi:hypothetical protein
VVPSVLLSRPMKVTDVKCLLERIVNEAFYPGFADIERRGRSR